MKKMALGVALMAVAGLAQAQRGYNQGFNPNNVYFGGGLSSNDMDNFGGKATGFQFFGGYKLDMINLGAVKSAVEVGYMDSGNFERTICYPTVPVTCSPAIKASASGLWANYVASYPLAPNIDAIGRLGLDFGDDDGIMFGIGAGFKVAPQLDIRGEYVVRQHINSLQANLVYYIK